MPDRAPDRFSAVGEDGYVSADDVLFLRRNVFKDRIVSRAEIESLFALAAKAPAGDPEWPMFFEEAAADFFLREEEPLGYLTPEEVAYLKERVGDAPNPMLLGALVALTEKAVRTAPEMTAFVATQLRRAILDRPTGARVTKADAALVSRFIYAAGGDGNVRVTRAEAEFLFDINDATRGAGNDPAWAELFVNGVAAHLMSHFTYEPEDRETAARRRAFLADHTVDVGRFFRRMISGWLAAVGPGSPAQASRNDMREQDSADAERLEPAEADWLADRIGRDGSYLPSERALLARMRELGADLPRRLKALVDRAA